MYEKGRIEAISDGVIAIIMTILVLEIPLPVDVSAASLFRFVLNVALFCVGFIVTANYWKKHYFLFRLADKVSLGTINLNIIFLMVLALVPLSIKWIVNDPRERIPAFCYTAIYLTLRILMEKLSHKIVSETDNQKVQKEFQNMAGKMKQERGRHSISSQVLMVAGFIVIPVVISLFVPLLSNAIWIVLPVIATFADNKKGHQYAA